MPVYKNSRTGATITVASVCSGGDWKEVKPKKTPTKGKKVVKNG